MKILDRFEEGNSFCFLCKVPLYEYISNLPKDFEEYYVQRGIVKNKFLDQIFETILEKRYIPSLTLVSNKTFSSDDDLANLVKAGSYKILDGLQRSKRIYVIYKTLELIVKNNYFQESNSKVSYKSNSDFLKNLGCLPSLYEKIFNAASENRLTNKDIFEGYYIWIEIWSNLPPAEQIRKMLLLNAGHKPVNIKHQIELLFHNYYEFISEDIGHLRVIREKDVSSILYSKNRKRGEFHFSHLITAFESLSQGKILNANADYSASKIFEQDADVAGDDLASLNIELLKKFASAVSKMDEVFSCDEGVRWLSREVVLVGVFAAIGKFAKDNNYSKESVLVDFSNKMEMYKKFIDVDSFEIERNNLNLSKVNIGNKNKKAVFKATYKFLENPLDKLVWKQVFGGEE